VLVHNSCYLSNTDDIKVIGRLEDTSVAKEWAGHDVLSVPQNEWTLDLNMEWIDDGIKNKQDFYVASPMSGNNLVSTNPQYPGLTVFGQEINRLEDAGYELVGDVFMHPDKLN